VSIVASVASMAGVGNANAVSPTVERSYAVVIG
jgi:hypothetical protein